MKHLLILLVGVVLAYTAWTLADKGARKTAMRSITYHGIRLGFLILVLLLLMSAAYYMPSSSLL